MISDQKCSEKCKSYQNKPTMNDISQIYDHKQHLVKISQSVCTFSLNK